MDYKEILKSFDDVNKKKFDDLDVSGQLKTCLPPKGEEFDDELKWEIMAFEFSENYQNSETGWGTYYGPMWSGTLKNGEKWESPSLKDIKAETIEYWTKRGNEVINPFLISRYSSLVIEFSPVIVGSNAHYTLTQKCINAFIDMANGDFNKHEVDTFTRLKKALILAISINDNNLIEKVKLSLIKAENAISEDSKPGLWGYCFDLLLQNIKVTLTEKETADIIDELEQKLARLTDTTNINVDPWAAEKAAIRLAEFYKKQNLDNEVLRVISLVGSAYDLLIEKAEAIQAVGWLENLHEIYKHFNLTDLASTTLLRIQQLGPKASKEMKSTTHSFELPAEKMEMYIKEMTTGDIESILLKIAKQYIPKKEEVKKQVFELSTKYPVQFLFTKHLQDNTGRVVAHIGPIKNDLEGHIIIQISQNMSFSSMFINAVFNALKKNSLISSNDIIDFIRSSPVLEEDKLIIIKKGLDAFFNEDYIVAIHLIIPQIEAAIRKLLAMAGGIIAKPARDGGHQLKTLGTLLHEEKIEEILGVDIITYYKILFTDPRGWNLRNRVCHGDTDSGLFEIYITERLIHSLLLLGLIKEKE